MCINGLRAGGGGGFLLLAFLIKYFIWVFYLDLCICRVGVRGVGGGWEGVGRGLGGGWEGVGRGCQGILVLLLVYYICVLVGFN